MQSVPELIRSDNWLDRKVPDTQLNSTVFTLLHLLFNAAPEQDAIMNGG